MSDYRKGDGRKRVHDKGFMGIDKKTGVQYTNCAYCDKMWADDREMTKQEIEDYNKRPHDDFFW